MAIWTLSFTEWKNISLNGTYLTRDDHKGSALSTAMVKCRKVLVDY